MPLSHTARTAAKLRPGYGIVAIEIITNVFRSTRVNRLLMCNARPVNEGRIQDADVFVVGDRIGKTGSGIAAPDRRGFLFTFPAIWLC